MKKGKTLGVIALTLLAISSSAMAYYADNFSAGSGSLCVIPKLDGDKVPFPVTGANTKFDLVEGETYILNGFVAEKNGRHYFTVDFASQPWLSTKRRTQRPYFLLDIGNTTLKVYGSEMVQVAVVAGKAQSSSTVEILRLIIPPIPYHLSTHRR